MPINITQNSLKDAYNSIYNGLFNLDLVDLNINSTTDKFFSNNFYFELKYNNKLIRRKKCYSVPYFKTSKEHLLDVRFSNNPFSYEKFENAFLNFHVDAYDYVWSNLSFQECKNFDYNNIIISLVKEVVFVDRESYRNGDANHYETLHSKNVVSSWFDIID